MKFFKAIPNSINFYKGVFLYVIPVRIIVPCFYYLYDLGDTFKEEKGR